MLIVLSVSRLNKLIKGIQVADHNQVKPDRFKVNAIITVYMAKFETYFLFSILTCLAVLVNDTNDGCLVLPFAEFAFMLCVSG